MSSAAPAGKMMRQLGAPASQNSLYMKHHIIYYKKMSLKMIMSSFVNCYFFRKHLSKKLDTTMTLNWQISCFKSRLFAQTPNIQILLVSWILQEYLGGGVLLIKVN
jgi:hypothetical protein